MIKMDSLSLVLNSVYETAFLYALKPVATFQPHKQLPGRHSPYAADQVAYSICQLLLKKKVRGD